MDGLKVVTTAAMAAAEKQAYMEGAEDAAFMESAGIGVAEVTIAFVQELVIEKSVILFCGKGNNAGDAYVAGCHLKEEGFHVQAFQLYPLDDCSDLCAMMCDRFQQEGGQVHFVTAPEQIIFTRVGLIIDGLVGTGFKGAAEGLLLSAIERINHSGLPVISIDIPSGLNGTTGVVETEAVEATLTAFLGLPKLGFFLNEGLNYIGELVHVDFGLDEEIIEEMEAKAILLDENTLRYALPKPKRTRHKYEAGYVLGVGGSRAMPGAPLLTSHAAFRAGAGIVRLFHPEDIEEGFSSSLPELIHQEWDLKEDKPLLIEAQRARALFIGPGMGRTKEAKKATLHLLQKIVLPTVIDADALFHLADEKHPHYPETTILTPHHGEMRRFLTPQEDLWRGAQTYADTHDVTIVLKGAPTVIFHPQTLPLILPFGDPGMATAGSGDVLTGILAALLAQGLLAREAASLGTLLHALAGEAAAFELTSYSLMATDLIDYLPDAIHQLISSADS